MSDEAKFTKGPLNIMGPSPGGGPNDDGGDYAVLDSAGCIIGEAICRVEPGETRDARANATLWAAAPEMYKALKRICVAATKRRGGRPAELLVDEIDAGFSVLAKARGES